MRQFFLNGHVTETAREALTYRDIAARVCISDPVVTYHVQETNSMGTLVEGDVIAISEGLVLVAVHAGSEGP